MEVSPLCIILVKSDSKGDRLLFRYPFQIEENKEQTNKTRRNPYTLPIVEDLLQNVTMSTSSINNINKGVLTGFTDEVLSSLFAVKMDLCDKNFELKVNDVRFVSLPTYLQLKNKQSEKDDSSFMILNIIFALSALASRSVVECYHSLSYRIGEVLKHEEKRLGYVSEETQTMMAAHDDGDTENNNETAFQVILEKCTLAKTIKKMYEDLCSTGLVNIILNKFIPLTFCLPQKVHQWHLRGKIIEPEDIKRCVSALRPYHSLLLLYPVEHIINFLSLDGPQFLVRMLSQYSPLKNLQMMATDSDLSLVHVFQFTSHLVYWAKATVIFPICSKNKYAIASDAPIHLNSPLIDEYSKDFPGNNLLQALSEFSLPTSLGQKTSPICDQSQQKLLVKSLIWMLQHHLLVQLHTYIQFMPTESGISNLKCEKKSIETPSPSSTMMSSGLPGMEPESRSTSSLSGFLEFVKMRSEYENKLFNSVDEDKEEYQEELADFPDDEKSAIFKIPSANNSDDIKLFAKLCRKGYFQGSHHIEEIMYMEDLQRSQLMQLLDKFQDVLVSYEAEDLSIALFSSNSLL